MMTTSLLQQVCKPSEENSSSQSEPMPAKWSLGRAHVWRWREEASISVYTLGTWKIKAQVFCWNVIWRMILRMVNRGLTSDTVIHNIYSVVYAGTGTSVTKIINVIDDRKRGRLNPNLELCNCSSFLLRLASSSLYRNARLLLLVVGAQSTKYASLNDIRYL